MTKYFGLAATAMFMFALPAMAQTMNQGADAASGSRISRPAPPPAQMSPAAAEEMAKSRIAADKQAGKIPERQTLQILLSAQASLKDDAGVETTLEEEVADYNDPADWVQIIDITFATPGLRDQDVIWLGRLLFLTGAPVPPNDASMVGAVASQRAFFGDAVNAKAHGGMVDPDPAPRADEDRKTIAQQIAGEKTQDGAYNAKLAEALYG